LKYLPPRHPSLAASYNNIAGVYYNIRDKSTALLYFEKSLSIDQRSLPSNHPSLSITHYNIARVLENLFRYKEAIEHAKQAVDIVCYTLDSTHPQKQIYQNYLDQLQQRSY
jgi:tetratricopeptide (TPR) repeat protein